MLKKGSLRGAATATPATFATHSPYTPPTVATVATVAVAKPEKVAANDPAPGAVALPGNDPDTDCWPYSTAMTGSEIDLFTARLARFTDKGVTHGDAESLADKLVTRDRDDDDRALCLECTHLAGWRTSWRCGNWQAAGIARQARDAQLPADLVLTLQRCDGLTNAFTPAPVSQ
jgi:hypothetical protein